MLSNTSRSLTYVSAAFYAVLGMALFAMPEKLAPVFTWNVSPFMAMTIGGWCLGNAWLAFFAARRWQWTLVQPSLLYLWLFGLLEMSVLITFREKANISSAVAATYVATLSLNAITAVIGIVDYLRTRPTVDSSGGVTSNVDRIGLIAFLALVGFLGYYGVTAQNGDIGTNGGIFPEIMTLFTLRGFGVFYLSIALAVIPLLWNRNKQTFLSHAFLSYGLIVFITAAAFVYLGLFDFASKPGGLLYFGAYFGVGMYFLISFFKFGIGQTQTAY